MIFTHFNTVYVFISFSLHSSVKYYLFGNINVYLSAEFNIYRGFFVFKTFSLRIMYSA